MLVSLFAVSLLVYSCYNSTDYHVAPTDNVDYPSPNDYSTTSIPPQSATWKDWLGDWETGSCVEGERRICIELTFLEEPYFDDLNRAIAEDEVAEYLNSDEGKLKFPYEEGYAEGLLDSSRIFLNFEQNDRMYYVIY